MRLCLAKHFISCYASLYLPSLSHIKRKLQIIKLEAEQQPSNPGYPDRFFTTGGGSDIGCLVSVEKLKSLEESQSSEQGEVLSSITEYIKSETKSLAHQISQLNEKVTTTSDNINTTTASTQVYHHRSLYCA